VNFDDLATVPATRKSSQNSPQEKQRAALYVAAQADSADDARELLDALGLLPARPRTRRAAVPATTTADCPINTTTTYGGTA
jgi:hypothetical protein